MLITRLGYVKKPGLGSLNPVFYRKGEVYMKPLLSPFTMILIVLVLGIAGCTNQPTQPPPTQTSIPEAPTESASETVQKMVERMNAGDVEGSLAYFADDATAYIIGLPPTGMEVYAGKEQIRTLWQDSVANHFQWETEITSVEGNIVYVQAKTWHDFTRQLEVAPLEYIDVYDVKDGKITTYGTTITADALARFKPAFAAVMPPEEPAAPSTEKPVSEMAVTVADGTCAIDRPAPLQAGEITVTFNIKDQNKVRYALTIFNMDQDKDILDLMASTAGMPPSWADMLLMEELEPGKSATYTITIEKEPVYMVCWSKYPELPIGNAGPIEVKE
jgi:ketosteroid isomerase-like protein